MTELAATAYGRSATYRLESDALVITSAGSEKSIALSSIERVRLAELGGLTICELRLRDGTTRSIVNDDSSVREPYARIVIALHEALASTGDSVSTSLRFRRTIASMSRDESRAIPRSTGFHWLLLAW